MDGKLEIKIPDEAVKAMVYAEIAAQIGDPIKVLAQLIRETLSQKVKDPQGRSYTERPRVEWLFVEQVERIAKDYARQYVEENTEQIRAAVAKAVRAQTFASKATDALVTGLGDAARWRISVDLKVDVEPRGSY
ncbi:MAG TPA: hypothetical protein VLT87_11200 [Thermoanaerobaculia bacterium]|nr:hypothetical protein [Thermoanaerobaculia bacterium]